MTYKNYPYPYSPEKADLRELIHRFLTKKLINKTIDILKELPVNNTNGFKITDSNIYDLSEIRVLCNKEEELYERDIKYDMDLVFKDYNTAISKYGWEIYLVHKEGGDIVYYPFDGKNFLYSNYYLYCISNEDLYNEEKKTNVGKYFLPINIGLCLYGAIMRCIFR